MSTSLVDWDEKIKCPHCKKKIVLDCQDSDAYGTSIDIDKEKSNVRKSMFEACKKCGWCCHVKDKKLKKGNHVSKEELLMIEKQVKRKLNAKKEGDLYIIPTTEKEECQFLSKKGCILKRKPLTCKLFPFQPTMDGWIMRLKCPYWFTFGRKEFNYAKKHFKKYRKDWKVEVKEGK